MCKRLKRHNLVLHNERNEARDGIEAPERKLTKAEEEDVDASSAATKEHFEAYCAKIAKDLVSLHEAYEGNINSLGGN
jgi:hypothetical protein